MRNEREPLSVFIASQLRMLEHVSPLGVTPDPTSPRYKLLSRVSRKLEISRTASLPDLAKLIQDYYRACAFDEGERLLCSALREPFSEPAEYQALLHRWLGVFRMRDARVEEGIVTLHKAKDLYAELHDAANLTKCHRNLATAYALQGRWDRALQLLHCAREFAKEAGELESCLTVGFNMAILYHKQGDWRRALRVFRDVWRRFDAIQSENFKTNVLLEGTLIIRHLGFSQTAEGWGHTALERARLCGFRRGEALALLYLGDIQHDLGDPRLALRHYQDALAITNGAAPDGDLAVDCYRRLAEASLALGNLEGCESMIKEGYEKASRTNEQMAHIGLQRVEGRLAIVRGRIEQGRASFEAARSACRARGLRFEEGRTDDEFARALSDVGRTIEARKPNDDAVRRYASLRVGRLARRVRRNRCGFGRALRPTVIWHGRGFVTHDEALADRLTRAADQARRGASLLIIGEPGTGRSALATAIHRSRPLRGRLHRVCCEELSRMGPDARQEALTAIERLATQAAPASLVLCELGALSPEIEPDVLGALHVLVRGSRRPPLLMTTVSRPDAAPFRSTHGLDEFLSHARIALAPLRERRADIEPLVRHFMHTRWETRRVLIPGLSEAVRRVLEAHGWRQGNVRELQCAVLAIQERIGDASSVQLEHLPPELCAAE